MIAEKRALAERVVGDGEGWLTELSTDDLARCSAWTRSPTSPTTPRRATTMVRETRSGPRFSERFPESYAD